MIFKIEMMVYTDNIYTDKPVNYYGIAFKEQGMFEKLKPSNDETFSQVSNDESY